MLSFNSYGDWVYIDKENNSDTEVYVLTDSIEIEDEYVYWTYLNNYSEPRSEYNIMGVAIFRGAECENNRYINIESQMFKGSMGTEPFGERLKPEQEWTTPSSGQIDEKIFNYVCKYSGFAKSKVPENSKSEADLILEGRKAYVNGDTYPEAHDIWYPLAKKGNAEAQYYMSWLGRNGISDGIAKQWLIKSAEQGYAPALNKLGNNYIYANTYRGYKKDEKKGIDLLKQAVELGYPDSQLLLGTFYLKGKYVLKNTERGLSLITKAAEQNVASAQNDLGNIYLRNSDVPINYKKAFYWLKKAAEGDHPSAQVNLGLMYINGHGTRKSLKEAAYWVGRSYDTYESRGYIDEDVLKIWNDYELWKYE